MKTSPATIAACLTLLGISAALPLMSGCGGAGTANPTSNAERSYGANGTNGNADGKNGAAAGKPAAGPTGRLGVFATAQGTKAEYDRVWVNILRVELLDVAEKAVTLYESVEGRRLDLSRLSSSSSDSNSKNQRYALIGVAAAPAGRTYNRVRVTFDKSVLLFAPGTPTAKVTPFSDALARDAEGRPILSFPLAGVRDFGSGKDNLVIGFDLAKFAVAEGRVIPALGEGDKAGLADASRQDASLLRGTVSELTGTAPDAVFTLTDEKGQTASVKTSALTLLYNATASPNPALAEGKTIEVSGTFDTGTNRLAAREITVLAEGAKSAPVSTQVSGMVSSVNKDAATFALTADQIEGVGSAPGQRAVTVLLAPDAVLRSRSGLLLSAEDFWTALSAKGGSPAVLARLEGEYEPVSGTLRARAAKLAETSPASAHEIEVEGIPQTPDAGAGTLRLGKLLHWDGLITPTGEKGVPVTTTAATAYRDEKGEFIALATFFAQAKEANRPVRVVGLYTANGALTATRLELRPVVVQEAKKPETPAAADKEAKAEPEKTDAAKAEAEKNEKAESEQTQPEKVEKAEKAEHAHE